MKKEQTITKDYLEKTLDKRLSQQAQVIIAAVDSVLQKRLEKVKTELKNDINNVQTLIDGYVKAQEDFKQEFVILKEEVKQIKQVLKKKLGVEIQAF
ncbi:MAG: hypothetical protein A2Y98_01190 [Candidatus Portnoybacteria bacterium RBG_19FT_COMBO_36_7]|uniref:Uncharacterized protein n=1 Tax=Candidatus Portnoybacteria bacterium RBG_19FT_COMBO_36_7 TaxID=1801992 RepID=A0A1G2F7J5_9BACT|nr:MAG: hypothetical protein A2Y98_01190 [Candidatus Portnoybacteria bacterium RBG_19FT_COMBO_36_7]